MSYAGSFTSKTACFVKWVIFPLTKQAVSFDFSLRKLSLPMILKA